MQRRYALLDVFTDTPLAGNPLAVVLDAAGLDPARMQAIAAEFHLSETVFVLPPENPLHTARLRIFTPGRELPFAGHPTVGTAVLLATEQLGGAGEGEGDAVLVLEEEIGPIRCGVMLHGRHGHALVAAPKLAKEVGPGPSAEAAATALALPATDIGFENHVPSVFTAGVPFVFVPVRNIAAIDAIAPQTGRWREAFGDIAEVYCYTRETVSVGRQFHARMFAPGLGIAEDPATGAAAAALAGPIRKFDGLPAGLHEAVIEQGFRMGRPSLIRLELEASPLALENVRLGGDAVIIGRGTLDID